MRNNFRTYIQITLNILFASIQNFPNSELDSSSDSYNASTKLKITSVNLSLDDNVNAISCVRSVLYQLKSFGSCTSVDPLQLPPTLKICKVVTNEKHFIVISSGIHLNLYCYLQLDICLCLL